MVIGFQRDALVSFQPNIGDIIAKPARLRRSFKSVIGLLYRLEEC